MDHFYLRYHSYLLQRRILRMTEFLPTLLWRPSPNFSSRRGTRVDLLVLHDCERGYEGSVRWFELSRSSVSAHYVVRKDGGEATQMVDLADNAWHACTFKSALRWRRDGWLRESRF